MILPPRRGRAPPRREATFSARRADDEKKADEAEAPTGFGAEGERRRACPEAVRPGVRASGPTHIPLEELDMIRSRPCLRLLPAACLALLGAACASVPGATSAPAEREPP